MEATILANMLEANLVIVKFGCCQVWLLANVAASECIVGNQVVGKSDDWQTW